MARHRTTTLWALALLLAGIAAAPATPAKTIPIVFPLVGDVVVENNYGDPRPNGPHAGIDMMAPRRTPVVAAEAGKVKWWTTSSRAGCMLYFYGASGTTYLYIHLNNDRSLGNDNDAGCKAGSTYVARDGARVTAGELVAWSGDSGDADGNPHLHFEVHPNDGRDVNPYPSLVAGERLLFPGRLGTRFTVGLRGNVVAGGGGTVGISVSAVRWWPGGRWTEIGERVVRLAIGKGAQIDASLVDALGAASERSLAGRAPASPVTIFTSPAKVTEDALRGVERSLVAARVTRPGGTLVAAEPEDEPEPEEPAEPELPPRPY